MNGYKIQSEAYKKHLSNHPEEPQEVREEIQQKISALDFVAEHTEAELMRIFDTGAFNKAVKGYLSKAADNLDLGKQTRADLLEELGYLFDTIPADEAAEYYKNS